MRIKGDTSATLIANLFLQPNLPICSIQAYHSNAMPAAVIAACHGGGPMPLLADPGHASLIKTLSQRVPKVLHLGTPNAPRAIVLVTAHWSESRPTISNASKHKLYYDYGGFPPESYKLRYNAPGSPDVAQEVHEVLQKAGLDPKMDSERGWDHGVFVPLTLINPAADIPVIQLSVLSSNSPAQHYAMGRALAFLRESNVAIIGSGMPNFHNLRLMFSGALEQPDVKARNLEWNKKLNETIALEESEERGKTFEHWRDWIGAKEAHPQGGVEHFLPLIVCAGAAGKGIAETFADDLLGSKHYTYYWN